MKIKSDTEYWRDLGLSWSDLRGVTAPERCYVDQLAFNGCLGAFSAAVASYDPKLFLLPSAARSELKLRTIALVPEKSFGVISVFRRTYLPNSGGRKNEPRFRDEQALWQSWSQFLRANWSQRNAPSSRIHFDELNRWVENELLAGKNRSEVVAAAYNGYLKAYDAHSYIVPDDKMREQDFYDSQKFGGIGVSIRHFGTDFVLDEIRPEGAAASSGLEKDDILLEVDHQALSALSTEDVVNKIRGEVNTPVTLGVARGDKALNFVITRREIKVANVEQVGPLKEDSSIHYAKLNQFESQSSCRLIEEAVKEAERAKAKGFVLDLRGNGGGAMNIGTCIAAIFLPKGQLISTRRSITDPKDITEDRVEGGLASKLNFVVLLDADSASASEVLAGAMQESGRAWVVGERSFGKASSQELTSSASPISGTYYAKTKTRIFLPSGRTYQGVGIIPDFEAYPVENPSEQQKFALREADLYPNALNPMGSSWVNPRAQQIAKMERCMAKGTARSNDYQIKRAVEVLRCAL